MSLRTTCPYCGVGCGLKVSGTGASRRIEGDEQHPANYGRLCSKGSALGETLGLEQRLLQAEIGGRPVALSQALDAVADGFRATIAEHGPDSVALYVSGQLLSEDYYVANKLMKGFIGSANIDTNSRLCMSSTVAGQLRAFGSDSVPGCYDDIELADLVLLVGSNLAWCHPVLFQRLRAAKEARPELKVVLIDPRRTASAELADLHLPLINDADALLFAALLAALARRGQLDADYLRKHVADPDHALQQALALNPRQVFQRCGIAAQDFNTLVDWLCGSPRTVTLYSQGVNQSAGGSDKVNAILNLHLACGRIGKPGSSPFSLTGQPNAMGGREVGGLANLLAGHMRLDQPADRERLQRFWNAPRMASSPGAKAVDLFAKVGRGEIRALWVIGSNPAVSMPQAAEVERALAGCPLLVVSEVMKSTDTSRHADIRLPALAWGEKSGTVTNSERRISRQRAFLPAPGAARADWWLLAQVAQRMGWAQAFSWSSEAEVFAEHARLSGFENPAAASGSRRLFDISAWADCSAQDYAAMTPFQWPARCQRSGDAPRLFAHGGFLHADARARLVRLDLDRLRAESVDPRYPLALNSGRVRDHWHTLTHTGQSPSLSQHMAEPYVELHPADAASRDIHAAHLVEVESAHGRVVMRALLSQRVRPGQVFVPMHWNDQFASQARIGQLFDATRDPQSGQPALKDGGVELRPWPARCYGFAVLVARPTSALADYWALSPCPDGWRLELAWVASAACPESLARRVFGCPIDAELLGYVDQASAQHRYAWFEDGRLRGLLSLAAEPVEVDRQWWAAALADPPLARLQLLAGKPGQDQPAVGPIVCACWQVGRRVIERCIAGGAADLGAVGQQVKAGSQCGSCRPEIAELLRQQRARDAAQATDA